MATTAAQIADYAGWAPFYVLRIQGLPFDFYATINPYSSAFGSNAWELGEGRTAVPGLALPDDPIEQRLPDIIGGIASAERIKLELLDFDSADTDGKRYKYFGRRFATGRAMSVSTVKKGTLYGDLDADEVDELQVRSSDTFPEPGELYIGGETIGYQTVSGPTAGVLTFEDLERNLYPCNPNFPLTPYYQVEKDDNDTVIPAYAVPVTTEPLMLEGRIAALWVGHMRPASGVPELEENALCRLVGRIQSLGYKAGKFTLEIESVMTDLVNASVAPGLGRVDLQNYVTFADDYFRKFTIAIVKGSRADGAVKFDYKQITLPTTEYSGSNVAQQICDEINRQLKDAAVPVHYVTAVVQPLANGEQRVAFRGLSPKDAGASENYSYRVMHEKGGESVEKPGRVHESLLTVLGFPGDKNEFLPDDGSTFGLADSYAKIQFVIAPKPMASVFIPTITMNENTVVPNATAEAVGRFFSNQGDVEAREDQDDGRAFVRLGDGQIVELADVDGSARTLMLGSRIDLLDFKFDPDAKWGGNSYYYVPQGAIGSIEQVVVVPDPKAFPPVYAPKLLGQLLASTAAVPSDASFNIYPQGVGLGFASLIDTDSWSIAYSPWVRRQMIIDRHTTFRELFEPVAQEYGLFAVWDPATAKIVLRDIGIPSAASASSFNFDEDNRASPNDDTEVNRDFTFVQVGWELQYGWDALDEKFLATPVRWNNYFARSFYQVVSKVKKIEDKTLPVGSDAPLIVGKIIRRSVYYNHPWIRAKRRINKRGLTLAPGTFHKLIDNITHNPFTGKFGIVTGDKIYGYLIGVQSNLATGDVEVEFLINGKDDNTLFRPWSPTALVDRGFGTNGYTSGSKTLYLDQHYTASETAADGSDFRVGDLVTVATRDNDGAPTTHNDTIATVAVDGTSVTLTTGLSAGMQTALASYDAIMYLRKYDVATAARQSGADAVSWLGDSNQGQILDLATNNKFV